MRKSKIILIVAAFAATITSCQKQKLEKLSGTWEHEYIDDNPYDDFKPDKYLDISFYCDSFKFTRIVYDDVYFSKCSCNFQTDTIIGVYSLKGNELELTGYYLDSTFVNFSISTKNETVFYQKYKIRFLGNSLFLDKEIEDFHGKSIKLNKTSEIKCL
jgi:hypothetical protein